MNHFGRVAVLYGGNSAEREVSLNSGRAVHEALVGSGVDAVLVDAADKKRILHLKEEGFARAFIALHGRGGEDGQMQALLEWQGLPYTGSGVLACALAMDKLLCKALWRSLNLPVQPDYVIRPEDDYHRVQALLGADVFAVKPALEGSSIGVSRVSRAEDWASAYEKAGGAAEKIMAEPWIQGRELSFSIVGETVLPGVEVVPSSEHAFYDYEAKYVAEDTHYLCPAPLDEALQREMQALALSAFQAIGAKGWGRVDMMLDEALQPWLLEVNLAPGMTSHSLLPLSARVHGMAFADVLLTLLRQA